MRELTQMPNPMTIAKYATKTNMSAQCKATLTIAVGMLTLDGFNV